MTHPYLALKIYPKDEIRRVSSASSDIDSINTEKWGIKNISVALYPSIGDGEQR